MSRRLRTDRMKRQATGVRDARALRESVARLAGRMPAAFIEPVEIDPADLDAWQRAWDEAMANDPGRGRIIQLPSRTVIRSERPRKSAPRGVPRMRKHRRELLINAMRWDGTHGSHELGLPAIGEFGKAAMGAYERAFADAYPQFAATDSNVTDPNGATP